MTQRSLLLIACCIALSACGESKRKFLINVPTSSPLLEVAVPRTGAACARRELHFSVGRDNTIRVDTCDNGRCSATKLDTLAFLDRSGRASPTDIRLGSGDPTKGPVTPVEGPDGLLWLCREDEEEMVCICIPWFPD